MKPDQIVEAFGRHRATVILCIDHEECAAPAMQAAVDAGFRIIEFTLTIPGALERIEEFSRRPGLIVGAGTVLSPTQAREAVERGARFLVSPVVDESVIEEALALEVPMIPGTHTPTEMLRAKKAGAPMQKLFPAPGYGAAFVRACLGPLPDLRIVPTSGVDASNAAEYLDAGAWAVGFVNPLFDPELVRGGDYAAIEQRGRDLLAAIPER